VCGDTHDRRPDRLRGILRGQRRGGEVDASGVPTPPSRSFAPDAGGRDASNFSTCREPHEYDIVRIRARQLFPLSELPHASTSSTRRGPNTLSCHRGRPGVRAYHLRAKPGFGRPGVGRRRRRLAAEDRRVAPSATDRARHTGVLRARPRRVDDARGRGRVARRADDGAAARRSSDDQYSVPAAGISGEYRAAGPEAPSKRTQESRLASGSLGRSAGDPR